MALDINLLLHMIVGCRNSHYGYHTKMDVVAYNGHRYGDRRA